MIVTVRKHLILRRMAAALAGLLLSLLFVTANQAAPVTLPQEVAGGEQSAWFITNEGGVGTDTTGQEYCNGSPGFTVEDARIGPAANDRFAFDNGATVWVNGKQFSATTTSSTVDREDRRIKSRTTPMSGVNVSVEYYVAASSATLRTLADFHNPSSSSVTITVSFRTNVESDVTPFIPEDRDGEVTPTSTGDRPFTKEDRWVITGNPNNVTDTAVVSHVLWGPDSPQVQPKEVRQFVFACPPNPSPLEGQGPNQGIAADYDLVVPPNSTRSLMFFNQLNGSFEQASQDTVAAYDDVDTLGADRLHGLGPAELLRIVNWKFAFNKFFVTGPGSGMGPLVRVIAVDPAGTLAAPLASFNAYNTGHTGGVTVATGDVDGDGFPEIITAPGPGGGPHIRVWKLDSNSLTVAAQPFAEFFAYSEKFLGGVFVGAGDVNGDGKAEVVTGAGPGGGPHVRIFRINAEEPDPKKRAIGVGGFYAYPQGFTGGVRVTLGNIVGDNKMEIVTGSGPGIPARVRVFGFTPDPGDNTTGYVSEVLVGNGRPGAETDPWDGFFPYGTVFSNGVFVGTAHFVGDSHDEIITGPGSGHDSRVGVYALSSRGVLSQVASFLAYDPGFTGGVRVGGSDLDSDINMEVLTGAGPGGGPRPRTFNVEEGKAVFPQLGLFYAYDEGFRGGIWVSGYRSGVALP